MYTIALVHEAPRPTWTSKRLLSAFKNRGCRVLYVRPSQLSVSIEESVAIEYRDKKLEADAFIVRSLGYLASLEFFIRRLGVLFIAEKLGARIINKPLSLLLARDKQTSLSLLSMNGLRVPWTHVTELIPLAMTRVEKYEKTVVKPIVGSLGRGSFIVDNPDIAFHVFKMLIDLKQPIYTQKYIAKKHNRDIRAFVVGDRLVAAAYRYAVDGGWKTNIAQGAKPEPAEPSSELEEVAVKSARALGLDYAGVDIGEDEDGYIVFEVNAMPLWRGLYEATGVDPAEHIAEHVLGILRK